MNKSMKKSPITCGLILAFGGFYSNAFAVDLNYDSLSFLEEPIATHIGDTTIRVNGLVDAAIDLEEDDENEANLTTSFQVSAETQLKNSLTVGGAYFGEYDSDEDDEYSDNFAVYVGGIWGTLSAGDVTGMVREETRRNRGAGNAELEYDDHLGELDDKGVTYIGRFGPSKYAVTVDENEDFEIGVTYQRPLGNKDYRFSGNFRESTFESSDGTTVFDSQGVNVVAELTYGSTIYDIGLGLETLKSGATELDRKYVSAGISRKIGVWTVSAEAHVGDIEGDSEVSYALGASYDIARGTTLNLGINHSDSQVSVDNIAVVEEDSTKAVISLTYRF